MNSQSNLPIEFQKVFFTDSKFNNPILIEIPIESPYSYYEDKLNNPDIYESGMPTAKIRIGKGIESFDKSLLNYLVQNRIARIETLIQTTHNSNYGDRQEIFNFIFYNEPFKRQIFLDNSEDKNDMYIVIGHRKLKEITYQNQYEDSPLGMKRMFYSIVFTYQLINDLPSLDKTIKNYNGKGKIFLDPDDGVWKMDGPFDNLGFHFEDNGKSEYLKFIKDNYVPYDFDKNKNDLLLKLSKKQDSIRLAEERIKKYEDSLAYKLKYPDQILFPDSSIFNGHLVNGKRNGSGEIIFKDGTIYEGIWIDDLRDGNGKLLFKNGNTFYGQWKEDKISIKGKMTYSNGDNYEGDWVDLKKNGYGIMFYKDGNVYKGEWRDDKKNGKGQMVYNNKVIYEGKWSNDEINGQGILTYPDGDSQTGEFKNGILIMGTNIRTEKTVRYIETGEFQNGLLYNGTVANELLDCPKCAITGRAYKNGKMMLDKILTFKK